MSSKMVDTKVERLIQRILSKRKDITKNQIIKLIERKKEEIGSGYLTDMGALYLVASDLGISLEPQEEYFLDQIKEGMKNIDVISYFLFQNDEREFIDREGRKRKYRTIYLYHDNIVRAVLWDEAADIITRLALKPSEKIKIRRCSVRKSREGGIELHLNSQSDIIIEDDRSGEGKERLEKITEDVSNIDSNKKIHVVRGRVYQPKILSYVNRKSGEESKAISFYFKDLRTEDSVRVVLWGLPESIIQRIDEGQVLRIIGLRLRKGQYSEFELHGDNYTPIEILEISKPKTLSNFIVFSPGRIKDGKATLLLLNEETEKIFVFRTTEQQAKKLDKPGLYFKSQENKFVVKGNSIFFEEEVEPLGEKEDSLNKFKIKIIDLYKTKGPVIVEVTTLSKPKIQEIKTKNGEIVKKSTILVGDDTGETRIYAWRENIPLLDGIMPGERIIFYGLIPKKIPFEEETILEVKEFTWIEKRKF